MASTFRSVRRIALAAGRDDHGHPRGRAVRPPCSSSRALLCSLLSVVATVTVTADRPAVAATFGLGRSSRAARDEAVRAIPFDQLSREVADRVAAVVDKPSVYRRMPVKVIDCDPALYLFLIRQPEVVINIWDLMGITRIQMQRTGPYTFAASDGMGTKSNVALVYGTNETHVVYAEGLYDGPLLPKPVHGRCVLFLQSGYVPTASGRTHITNRLDVFVQLDNVAVDVLARTIHPLFGKTADLNFVQTVAFAERISQTAERNGAGMQRLAQRLADVDPSIRDRFAQLAADVSARQAQRLAAGQQVVPASAGAPVAVDR